MRFAFSPFTTAFFSFQFSLLTASSGAAGNRHTATLKTFLCCSFLVQSRQTFIYKHIMNSRRWRVQHVHIREPAKKQRGAKKGPLGKDLTESRRAAGGAPQRGPAQRIFPPISVQYLHLNLPRRVNFNPAHVSFPRPETLQNILHLQFVCLLRLVFQRKRTRKPSFLPLFFPSTCQISYRRVKKQNKKSGPQNWPCRCTTKAREDFTSPPQKS